MRFVRFSGDYILSSSDFGRAYLSEGWATSFIRQLLKNYMVVLLGYQADDPPVKYLLQGLNSGRGNNTKKEIYAFDQGIPDEIEAKWRDRGVIPVAYPVSAKHQSLWDTLEAWAIRSDNPAVWRESTIELAQKGPQNIKPHERGMVAHVLQTTIGVKRFADTSPSPPIEWLLVLDKNCRYAPPSKSHDQSEEIFDPLEAYGLDDDPPRPTVKERETPTGIEDLIAWRQGDDSLDQLQRLSIGFSHGSESMPSRLFHLVRWMLNHVEHPTLAWWVAKQYRLHSRLYGMLKREIEDSDKITDDIRKLWMIILEVLKNGQDETINLEWFQVERRIKTSGWTSLVLRAFETVSEPRFKFSSPSGIMRSCPPIGDWSKTDRNKIVDIDISFPDFHNELPKISEIDLPSVFEVLQRNLIRVPKRLNEADISWFSFATLYPEKKKGINRHIRRRDIYIIWFLELLERMVGINPKLLRAHIDTWPEPEKYIFDRLRLYVLNKKELFSGHEVAEHLLGLKDDQFWNSVSQQELLFLLRGRWTDFTVATKAVICDRILSGRPQYDGEEKEDYLIRKSTKSSIVFGWLLQNGCSMSKKWEAKYLKLKNGLAQWSDEWINGAVRSNEPKVGWVKTDENDEVLNDIPVDKIIDVAKEHTHHHSLDFTYYNPFLGLVKNKPAKSLEALLALVERDDYPIKFWDTLVANWPNTAPTEVTRKLCESVSLLPPEIVFEIRWTIGHFLEKQFPELQKTNEVLAFSMFDNLIEKLLSMGPEATKSSCGETRIGGKLVDRSRKTMNHASNSPLGKATEGLLKVLENKERLKEEGLPDNFKGRINLLLTDNGEGSAHTVCILSRQITWLNHMDPDWVCKKMIPWFNLEHPFSEPAWNGILFNDWTKIQSIFDQIKEHYLILFKKVKTWRWEEDLERSAHTWIIQATLLALNDGPNLTFDEARDCLRQLDHNALSHVIWFLARVGGSNVDGWRKMVMPFIQKAWPKERRYRTEKTSSAWVSMLENTQKDFPTIFKVVRKLLCPILSSHSNLYSFYRNNGKKEPLTVRFPDETLALLDLIVSNDPRYVPYGLSQVLNLLVETKPEIIADRRYERLSVLDAKR